MPPVNQITKTTNQKTYKTVSILDKQNTRRLKTTDVIGQASFCFFLKITDLGKCCHDSQGHSFCMTTDRASHTNVCGNELNSSLWYSLKILQASKI